MSVTPLYFQISYAVDTKETGKVYPTAESYKNYDFDSFNSIHKLRGREFPSFIPDIRFKLAKRAKLCDLLSSTAFPLNGLLLSEKFKAILEKYRSVPCMFHKAIIEENGIFHQYYYTQYVWNEGLNFINFKESKFIIKKFDEIIAPIQIDNYEDKKLKQKELGFIQMICSKEIVFNIINENLDVIIDPLNFGIYISEKLKNEIINNKLTGIELSPNTRLKIV